MRRAAGLLAALLVLCGLSGCGFLHRERPVYTEEEFPTPFPAATGWEGWDIQLEREPEGEGASGRLCLSVRYGDGPEERFTVRLQPGERLKLQLGEGRWLHLSADRSGEITMRLERREVSPASGGQ